MASTVLSMRFKFSLRFRMAASAMSSEVFFETAQIEAPMTAKMSTMTKVRRAKPFRSRTAFSVVFITAAHPSPSKFACLTVRHQRGNCKAKTAYDKGKTRRGRKEMPIKKLLRQGNRRSFAQYARRRRG